MFPLHISKVSQDPISAILGSIAFSFLQNLWADWREKQFLEMSGQDPSDLSLNEVIKSINTLSNMHQRLCRCSHLL